MNYRSTTLLTTTVFLAALSTASFSLKEHTIYPDVSVAKVDVQHALDMAVKSKKRIILDFGGNWCGDCVALDKNFHQEPNATLLKNNFILVDVNIGHFDKNADIAKRFGVPLEKGVPALAVLAPDGHVLYSQKNGEFEAMRTMDPTSVTTFLKRWKR